MPCHLQAYVGGTIALLKNGHLAKTPSSHGTITEPCRAKVIRLLWMPKSCNSQWIYLMRSSRVGRMHGNNLHYQWFGWQEKIPVFGIVATRKLDFSIGRACHLRWRLVTLPNMLGCKAAEDIECFWYSWRLYLFLRIFAHSLLCDVWICVNCWTTFLGFKSCSGLSLCFSPFIAEARVISFFGMFDGSMRFFQCLNGVQSVGFHYQVPVNRGWIFFTPWPKTGCHSGDEQG